MWARTTEVCLACWLAISPFIFDIPADQTFFWATDFIAAAVIILLSTASLHPPLNKLHLANLAVVAWLLVTAFLAGKEPPPPHQNHVVVALLLLMLIILPTRSDMPPRRWREFLAEKERP